MATNISAIEERQQYIEDIDQRRAKIQSLLQELYPEDYEPLYTTYNGEKCGFDPDTYQGDDASDFFWDLSDDFIYKHIDDLLACGVKSQDLNGMIGFDGMHDTGAFLRNFDTIADHVGHGIDFTAFAEAYGVDPEHAGEELFVDLFQAAYEDFFNQLAYRSSFPHPSHFGGGVESGRRFVKLLLDNGASAKQLIAESYAGYPDTLQPLLDLFLENDADANDIISRFDEILWESMELKFLIRNFDTLLQHGLDTNRLQHLGARTQIGSKHEKEECAKLLEAHGIEF